MARMPGRTRRLRGLPVAVPGFWPGIRDASPAPVRPVRPTTMSMLNPPVPQLAPMIRARLKQRIPQLEDEDLPTHAVSEAEFITRIARRTGDSRQSIRAILYEIGVFIPPRPARTPVRSSPPVEDQSQGSGIPDDTAQSGMMSAD